MGWLTNEFAMLKCAYCCVPEKGFGSKNEITNKPGTQL